MAQDVPHVKAVVSDLQAMQVAVCIGDRVSASQFSPPCIYRSRFGTSHQGRSSSSPIGSPTSSITDIKTSVSLVGLDLYSPINLGIALPWRGCSVDRYSSASLTTQVRRRSTILDGALRPSDMRDLGTVTLATRGSEGADDNSAVYTSQV